jgi:hypothetical protein
VLASKRGGDKHFAMEIQVPVLQKVCINSYRDMSLYLLIHLPCLSCRTRTVKQSKGCNNFDEERPLPKLGNLATHIRIDHPNEWRGDGNAQSASTTPIDQGYTAASAKLMEDYLAEGKLNPKMFPTKAGFLKHFAAWLIEEDLPFTTGEAPGLLRLFKYVDVTYQLPSDTTVRNVLTKIYAELHGEVVRELSVSQHKPQCIIKSVLTMPTEH